MLLGFTYLQANCQTHGIEYEAAKLEDRAGRKVVRSKRLEIDSLQSVINRAKNATSIEDIDSRVVLSPLFLSLSMCMWTIQVHVVLLQFIGQNYVCKFEVVTFLLDVNYASMQIHNMEHVMQHETLPLKEEKQFIREIKQLKQLREQLSSNMGSQDEIQQALDQRQEVEERLKVCIPDYCVQSLKTHSVICL